jgi:hypothetical protein
MSRQWLRPVIRTPTDKIASTDAQGKNNSPQHMTTKVFMQMPSNASEPTSQMPMPFPEKHMLQP